jgi:hypothetical protein
VRVTALRGLDNGGERMSVENTSTTYLGRVTAFHANYEFDNATLIQLHIDCDLMSRDGCCRRYRVNVSKHSSIN